MAQLSHWQPKQYFVSYLVTYVTATPVIKQWLSDLHRYFPCTCYTGCASEASPCSHRFLSCVQSRYWGGHCHGVTKQLWGLTLMNQWRDATLLGHAHIPRQRTIQCQHRRQNCLHLQRSWLYHLGGFEKKKSNRKPHTTA